MSFRSFLGEPSSSLPLPVLRQPPRVQAQTTVPSAKRKTHLGAPPTFQMWPQSSLPSCPPPPPHPVHLGRNWFHLAHARLSHSIPDPVFPEAATSCPTSLRPRGAEAPGDGWVGEGGDGTQRWDVARRASSLGQRAHWAHFNPGVWLFSGPQTLEGSLHPLWEGLQRLSSSHR